MKKQVGRACLILSPVALLACLCLLAIFAVPAQYTRTFLGALQDKMKLVKTASERPRMIVVGGSSVAFGQRSDLLESELPGYQVVNFGLYAGLGTTVMMDLSLPEIRPGDIVILSPEQNRQTLSGYFGAKAMWQAADGSFSLLSRISGQRQRTLAGASLAFAADKLKLWLSGRPLEGDGVYSRDNFNSWGDLMDEGREGNSMPDALDPDMPIRFDPEMLEAAFVQEMNEYAEACSAKGARVYYRFCPMNEAAISADELERLEEYTAYLTDALAFPILGRAEDSILEAGWFFDTNFHLNASGAVINTICLASQLKQELGIPGGVKIAAPAMPQAIQHMAEEGDDADALCFLWEKRDDGICLTGLTQEGQGRSCLTIPAAVEGLPVTAFTRDVFAGNPTIQELVIPASIRRIENESFAGCTSLTRLVLLQESPNLLSVGEGLLNGADCTVFVPADSYALYQTSYFWSMHASRIRPGEARAEPAAASPAPTVPVPAVNVMFADANGGTPIHGTESRVSFPLSHTHLRTNTPLGHRIFQRDGYVPLCWNTQPDGSGECIPFGSRADSTAGQVLYMQWAPLATEEDFSWYEADGSVTLTGWTGQAEMLAIPPTLGGLPVTCIAKGAFKAAQVETVLLPPSLQRIEPGAFTECSLKALWLYDSLQEISDAAFRDCTQLQTLYIHADTAPRYTVSYFGAFADKLDWLRQSADEKKLVMFGGSASRYAYNSKELHAAFPSYQMVNMGVYAYTNALPQYRLLQHYMKEGDVLLSAPEFDTTDTQFCKTNALDDCFWAMAEADYACASLLDLRQYTKVFRSLGTYLDNRRLMPERRYEESPRWYDDDGNAIMYETYNQYGDYTLLRPGGGQDVMLMYYRAEYTVQAFPPQLIESLNSVYQEFQQRGVQVLFAYAPRNHSSLTPESTTEERQALHAHLEKYLCVPMIISMEDGLYPGNYCYLIDSHLSDEGVYIHTKRIIRALRNAGLE